jgi:hypothetical protein
MARQHLIASNARHTNRLSLPSGRRLSSRQTIQGCGRRDDTITRSSKIERGMQTQNAASLLPIAR